MNPRWKVQSCSGLHTLLQYLFLIRARGKEFDSANLLLKTTAWISNNLHFSYTPLLDCRLKQRMALPSAGSLQNGPQFRKKKKVRYELVVALVFAVIVATYYSIIKPTIHVVKEQHVAELPLRHLDMAQPVETIESELLANEQQFLDTIKSCPSGSDKKCGEFIPESNGNKQRVALLAPPGEMSNMLWHWVQGIVQRHKKVLIDNSKHPIELIRTSHVPPYGYGKTHGLTKVIRLVPKPLVMGIADALQQIIVQSESHHDLTGEPPLHQKDIALLDLKAVLRQFMRFHCRLSKLAAHTAILSVNSNDYMDNYDETSYKLLEFLKYSPDKDSAEEEYGEEMGGGMEDVNLLSADLSFVTKILTKIQAESKDVRVLHVLDEVLRDELWKTKNLTNWPCESFWTVGEAHARTKLSPFAIKIARSFSPNCSAPFTNCWVQRDKCEAAGDGVCAKN